MGKNKGRFLCRETDYHEDGSRAITDTFVTENGELQYHIYNVSEDGSEHSHQITDEDGKYIYAREMAEDPEHPWHEIDRMILIRWIENLSLENIEKVLISLSIDELNYIKEYIQFTYANEEDNSFAYIKRRSK